VTLLASVNSVKNYIPDYRLVVGAESWY